MHPRLNTPCLCLVTDRKRTKSEDVAATVAASLDGGVDMVQLREKDMAPFELLRLARRLRRVTQGRALLIVNDRVDVALLAGADGVQLGETALDVSDVRQLVGPDMLIGRSVHSEVGAVDAECQGADFLVLGTVFETASHPDGRVGGLDLVKEVTTSVGIPVLGIGGITKANAASVMEAGASGAAVITAITMADDPKSAASDLSAAISGRIPSPASR
jgi:thiamine-phosphate pyrophosphorylase